MKPEKIIIIGASGSGKSTVARQLSAWWDIPVVHLDKLSWKEGWIRASNEEFDSLVEQELAKDKWIMDGNFPRTLKRRMDTCDTVIYLDYPLWFCIFRVLKRVIKNYGKPRPDMNPGCPEKFDPGFLKRIWNFNRERRDNYYRYIAEQKDTNIIILRNQKECDRFLASVRSEMK